METAVATASRSTARSAVPADVPFLLRDVEDLRDADLDGVLEDQLLDAGAAAASADVLAHLVGRPGEDAVFAHTLSARALLLAVR